MAFARTLQARTGRDKVETMRSMRSLRGVAQLLAARGCMAPQSTLLIRPQPLISLLHAAPFTSSTTTFSSNSRGFLSPSEPDPLRRTPPTNVGIR